MNYDDISSVIKEAMRNSGVYWKEHILQRMRQRNITVSEVLEVLNEFEIIEEYKDDRPFPSYLLIGYNDTRPIHLVVAVNSEGIEIHLITAYIPDSLIWEKDYRRKR